MAGTSFNRWHAAGLVRRHLPDVRGRDRLFSLIRGSSVPRALAAGEVDVRFGPDRSLHAAIDVTADGSFQDLYFCQFEPPVLVPIFEAALRPGDTLFDIGANIGIYSLWASQLVGPTGRVIAFEPVPRTRAWLERLLAANPSAPVTIVPAAVSSEPGEVVIETIAAASGRSHVTAPAGASPTVDAGAPTVVVEAITLDDAVATYGAPTLVKIDVEGHEGAVVEGMTVTLRDHAPVVVFEAPDSVGATGETARVITMLERAGYGVFSLTHHGLVAATATSFSHNLVALHPDRHATIRDRLHDARFRRNQNC